MVTINRAVDHLIDVLAGEDVPVVGSKATRVDQLANMIADGEIVIGGGGGSTVTDIAFTEAYDQDTSTYTLTNAAAVLGALEAILEAEDRLAEMAKYRFAVTDADKWEMFMEAFVDHGYGETWCSIVGVANAMAAVCAQLDTGTVVFYTNASSSNVVISASDIDAETGVLTKTFE